MCSAPRPQTGFGARSLRSRFARADARDSGRFRKRAPHRASDTFRLPAERHIIEFVMRHSHRLLARYLLLWVTMAGILASRVTRLGPGEGSGTSIAIWAYTLASLPLFIATPVSLAFRLIFHRGYAALVIGCVLGIAAAAGILIAPGSLLDYAPPWWRWFFGHQPSPELSETGQLLPLTCILIFTPLPLLFACRPLIARNHVRVAFWANVGLWILLTSFGVPVWYMFTCTQWGP